MAENRLQLVIGNKMTSSWSLRPWLALRRAGLAFEEIFVDLDAPGRAERLSAASPSGKVPVLLVDSFPIWDSLAILEYLAETYPQARLWPEEKRARALARSVSAEMHAGFAALREQCPMNTLLRAPVASLPEAAAADVRRIVTVWNLCRREHGAEGPFLFSHFTAADAMYAPVALRFRSYLPDLGAYGGGLAQDYVNAICAMSEMAEWEAGARAELAAKNG